jgi:hypothetical protein
MADERVELKEEELRSLLSTVHFFERSSERRRRMRDRIKGLTSEMTRVWCPFILSLIVLFRSVWSYRTHPFLERDKRSDKDRHQLFSHKAIQFPLRNFRGTSCLLSLHLDSFVNEPIGLSRTKSTTQTIQKELSSAKIGKWWQAMKETCDQKTSLILCRCCGSWQDSLLSILMTTTLSWRQQRCLRQQWRSGHWMSETETKNIKFTDIHNRRLRISSRSREIERRSKIFSWSF